MNRIESYFSVLFNRLTLVCNCCNLYLITYAIRRSRRQRLRRLRRRIIFLFQFTKTQRKKSNIKIALLTHVGKTRQATDTDKDHASGHMDLDIVHENAITLFNNSNGNAVVSTEAITHNHIRLVYKLCTMSNLFACQA